MPFIQSIRNQSFQNFNVSSSSPLPVSGAVLWFDGVDLSSISNGSNVSFWQNKGSLGSSFDLINTSQLSNSTGATIPPIKNAINSKHSISFDGSSNMVLWFRGFHNSPGSASACFYFDGNSSGGTSVNNRTLFFVYYTSSTILSAFGTYSGNYSAAGYSNTYDNLGWSYNSNYTILESNDGFPISTSGSTTITQNSIAQAGHSQNTSGTVNIWGNRTGSFETRSYSDGASSQVHPPGIGYGRSTKNNGHLFEIIVYDRTLNSTEINSVRNYLGSKYGQSANA